MLTFALIVTALAALTGLEWVARNLLALRVWRAMFHLTADYPLTQTDWPLLSVVVAARDEEANIAQCLRSLLAQDYPNLEVIAVNDRSADATGRIIREVAASDPRVRALDVEHLPAGWCGKNHAMQRGIELARGDWILMHDADCAQVCPNSLRLAMQHALDREADLVSLLPQHRYESFWEGYLLPILTGVLLIWFRPSRVNDPKRPAAFANGMFMLIRREAYRAVGTHEALRGSLIEDMDLARRLKKQGFRIQVAPSTGLFTVRMYTTLGQIWRGWERIFLGAFRSLAGLVKVLAVLIGRGLTPAATAGVGWAMHAAGAAPADWWLACAIIGTVGLAAQLAMTARFFAYVGSRWVFGLFYPIGCAIVAALLVATMLKLRPGGKITWRGTTYRLSDH